MLYRSQRQDFKIGATPQSTGELARLLRMSQHIRMGELAVFLYSELDSITGFNTRRFITSLVNVTNKRSAFSYGVCPPPPKQCIPLDCNWHFTFALSHTRYSQIEPQHILLNQLGVKTWFIERDPFVTLGVTSRQDFGLSHALTDVQQVFNIVGSLTRAQMLNDTSLVVFDAHDVEQMEDLHDVDLEIMRSSYLLRPVTDMLAAPFPFLPFSRQVWTQAPQLLVPAHLTPLAILAWLLFMPRVGVPPHLEKTMREQLKSAVLTARQLDGLAPTVTKEFLFAAMVKRGMVDDTRQLTAQNPLPKDYDVDRLIRNVLSGAQ